MSEEAKARESICAVGASIFQRGLTFGSTGNISVRLADGGWLMTPTNASLGALDPAPAVQTGRRRPARRRRSRDQGGVPAFRACTASAGTPRAVVHLHSTHSVAVSILADVDPQDVLPPLTAYFVMRVGRLPLVPYFPPGDAALAGARRETRRPRIMPCCSPITVRSSPARRSPTRNSPTEELEETAKLYLMLRSAPIRPLTPEQVDDLRKRYNLY